MNSAPTKNGGKTNKRWQASIAAKDRAPSKPIKDLASLTQLKAMINELQVGEFLIIERTR